MGYTTDTVMSEEEVRIMATADQRRRDTTDELYERYGKPLEREHWGEFVAVSTDGRTLLRPTLLDAAQGALQAFGPGSHIFKVGDRVVGGWRS